MSENSYESHLIFTEQSLTEF